jgi:hypothetical protein
MKKIALLFSFLFLGFLRLSAQELIAVDHTAGGSEFFTRLDSAIVHAANGDYIYLPGTPGMNIGTVVVDKSVHIIGAGTEPDSTTATGATTLTGNLIFTSGASNGSVQGIFVSGNITFGTTPSDQNISNFTVLRCNLTHLYLSYNGTSTATSSILVRENVLRGSVYGGYTSTQFQNNVIQGTVNNLYGATFQNNIFLYGSYGAIQDYVTNSTFTNNIFHYSCFVYAYNNYYNYWNSTNNFYYNNMFPGTLTYGIYSNYYGWSCTTDPSYNQNGAASYNVENVPLDSMYVNQSGNVFSYSHDFHLKPTCAGKNAGTDGTDVGIHGGASPWKEGSLPINPHIRFKNVAGTTNPNGTLNIHFKVAAQDN